MQKNDFVSLWLVNVDDEHKLRKIIEFSYDEDGDSIPSVFCDLFMLEFYDEDFCDIGYVGRKDCITELLNGFSYDYSIIPKFEKIIQANNVCVGDFNSAILLYNFKYTNDIVHKTHDNCGFQFVGNVKIESGLLCKS